MTRTSGAHLALTLIASGALALMAGMVMADDAGLHLECKIVVPQRFLQTTATPAPGELKRVRYHDAYEAFWWNCVAVKAEDMQARCPIVAKGTEADSDGGANGATDAMNGIQDLVKRYGSGSVQAYLKQLTSPPSMLKDKLHGWFDSKPTAEAPPQG